MLLYNTIHSHNNDLPVDFIDSYKDVIRLFKVKRSQAYTLYKEMQQRQNKHIVIKGKLYYIYKEVE